MRIARRGTRAVIGGAVLVLALGGAATAALLGRGGDGRAERATTAAPTRTGATTRAVLPAGDALLAVLPRPSARGSILLATPDCRLERLDVGSGRLDPVRPDLEACDAVAVPSPDLAVADVQVHGSPALRRIGRTEAGDRNVFSAFDRIPGRVVSLRGDVAGCFGHYAGFTGVTYVARRGQRPRVYSGCQAAWWNGALVRLDNRGAIVSTAGAAVARAPGSPLEEQTTGLLAASRDERTLAALARTRDGWRLAVYPAGSFRPRTTVSASWLGAEAPKLLRISSDGRLYAVADGLGRWTVARTDGTTPPAADVASLRILDVAFAPDSSAIAVSTADRLVFLEPMLLAPRASLPIAARSIDWSPSTFRG
jgi:hypothetical protein